MKEVVGEVQVRTGVVVVYNDGSTRFMSRHTRKSSEPLLRVRKKLNERRKSSEDSANDPEIASADLMEALMLEASTLEWAIAHIDAELLAMDVLPPKDEEST